jgi:CDP-6-deoxy-D-xylo-4-hexulose-3-dehydrase
MGYKKWENGDSVFINRVKWDNKEYENVLKVFENDWFAQGHFNRLYQEKLAEFAGTKYALATNSGSAALHIAVETLRQSGKISTGDLFLHPMLTFPTSLSGAILSGFAPVFCDVDISTYQINIEAARKAIEEFPEITFAIIPALVGNVPDLAALRDILGDRPIIVDSCDTMGSLFDGKEITSMVDIGCYSGYASHHVTLGGVGGGLVTDNEEYYKTAKSLIYWGRDFSFDVSDQLVNFLNRYKYATIGFDAQVTEFQAAFGLAQLEKLPQVIADRKRIFWKLQGLFSKHLNWFHLPERTTDRADPSWFGYPVCLKETTPFTREEFVKYLLDNKIEIRPIFAGMLVDQKPFRDIEWWAVDFEFTNTEYVDKNGFFIAVYGLDEKAEEYYFRKLNEFLEIYK